MTAFTDHTDVPAAAAGDAQAFERIYLRHEDRVRTMFVRLIRDPMFAEDLTQETFVMAWRKLSSLKNPAAVGRWLRRIGMNVFHDRLRARPNDPMRQPEEIFEDSSEAAGESDPSTRIDLERSIAALPDKYRRAFVLHHVDGYEHHEIARMLGVPVGTSKIHVFRATQLLRKALVA